VIQENRTPDNLFGAGAPFGAKCGGQDQFEAGVDIDNGGYGYINQARQEICNTPIDVNGTQDPDHSYQDQGNNGYGWLDQYHNGYMDGFCEIYTGGQCLQYSYVKKPDVQPYFDIAAAYGFANYMFQTNEGPSFPAHQFLFTGTSAPVGTVPVFPVEALDFVAENGGGDGNSSGCAYGNVSALVDPTGSEGAGPLECYPHDSLVTDSNGNKPVTWRYYTPTEGAIWDAPASIPEVCYGTNSNYTVGAPCGGPEWAQHIVLPTTGAGGGAPILADIQSCSLAQISWVIPDEDWSDHAGGNKPAPPAPPYGPSWVGNIIDAIGDSWSSSNHQCDYWGTNSPNAEPTAIFVVWDDWGGWFDHVPPPAVYRSNDPTTCPVSDAPNGWGCGYVYGFRVPLLVVSEFTTNYVSGACTSNCPNAGFPFVHDFGSILSFAEWNFGLQPIDPPYYADYNAPDGSNGHVPLADFFQSWPNSRGFTYISTPYPASTFQGFYYKTENVPTGPDGGSSD